MANKNIAFLRSEIFYKTLLAEGIIRPINGTVSGQWGDRQKLQSYES